MTEETNREPREQGGPLEFRSATVAEVSFPNRLIDLVVMPYEVETVVAYAGRAITEIVSRGAYDGIERRANRVRVNRDHVAERTVGRAISFHDDPDGLLARLRIAKTPLGDETLALADEECLDASAGFALLHDANGRTRPDAERWETRDRRRLNHLWLGHIAMTPDPAYLDARVLAVRSNTEARESSNGTQTTPTPNLDLVRGWLLEDRFAKLERKH